MPPFSSAIRHLLAWSADTVHIIQFKRLISTLSLQKLASTIPLGNFFTIVVFYGMGALIGCYAPIG